MMSHPGDQDQPSGWITGTIQHTASTWSMSAPHFDTYYEDCPVCDMARIEAQGTWIDNQRLGGTFAQTYWAGNTLMGTGTDGINLVYETQVPATLRLTNIVGTYRGFRAPRQEVEMTIAPNGTISGVSVATGCTFSGTVTMNGQAAESTIVYQTPCWSRNVTMRGVLGVDGTGKLYVMTRDTVSGGVFLFIGQRA